MGTCHLSVTEDRTVSHLSDRDKMDRSSTGSLHVDHSGVFVTYRQRFVVIACVMSLNMVGYMMAISFGPVASQAAEYYGVTGSMIDLFPIIGMTINMPGMFIAVYCIDRFGIKVGLRWGSTCLMIGAALRCLSTFPLYEEKIARNTKFWLTFLGQSIIALGHPFLITMSTKISQVWFAEKERIVSTAAMAGAPALGAAIGSGVTPFIVNDDPQRIPILNVVYPTMGLVGFILAWAFVTSPHPRTPPSLSAQKLREKDPVTVKIFFENIKKVISSNTIKSFIILMGGGVGIFNTLATQLGQMMCSTGYGAPAAGLAAGILIVTGLIGSFVLGLVAKKYNIQIEMAKTAFSMSTVGIILLCISLLQTNLYPMIIFSLCIFGFFGLGGFPISLELAVEETFPADPVFSEAFIHMAGQAQAVFFILVGNVMHWDPDKKMLETQVCKDLTAQDSSPGAVDPWDYTPYFYLVMSTGFTAAIAFIAFINPTLRRSDVDNRTNNKHAV